MTKRERVLAAINHKHTGIIPYNIELTTVEQKRVAEYLGDPDFMEKAGNHISTVFYDGYVEETPPGSGYWKDRFGVVWNRTVDKDVGIVADYRLKTSDMDGYRFPEINKEALHKDLESFSDPANETFRVADVGFTLFERAWTLRGMDNLLMDMVCEPEFTNELLDAVTEYQTRLIGEILKFDVDGFLFGDDWGQQHGMIMGPAYWRKYIKPRMKSLFQIVKDAGKKVMHHSCGDIYEIFPDLIDIGLDVYQTFQPEIYDIKKVKKEFGGCLTFWGGISTQKLLPYASPEEIKKVALETMDILGKNGGLIIAPTHAVPSDVPPENIAALIEVFQQQLEE